MDKLQKYFLSQVRDRATDVIRSRTTKSMYFNFGGHVVRISDHLPTDFSRFETSIIWTSNPDQYVLLRFKNGQVETLPYARAKAIAQSLSFLSTTLFESPANKATFRLERECYEKDDGQCILGVPVSKFNQGQMNAIKKMVVKVSKEKV